VRGKAGGERAAVNEVKLLRVQPWIFCIVDFEVAIGGDAESWVSAER
jgi:hypothetical protein